MVSKCCRSDSGGYNGGRTSKNASLHKVAGIWALDQSNGDRSVNVFWLPDDGEGTARREDLTGGWGGDGIEARSLGDDGRGSSQERDNRVLHDGGGVWKRVLYGME